MAKKKVVLPIKGMGCAGCANTIEKNLKNLEGVEEVEVDFSTERASVVYESEKVKLEDLIDTVRKTGYRVVREGVSFFVEKISE